jgi:serine phosphatase RsbU (regulator of sigma subunit)
MDVARKIQTVLLPQAPELSGYEVSAMMQPAAHVGGDYYDVFHAAGRDWVLVGDVSGHGVPAGLIMMMVQTAVRATVLSLQVTGETLTPSHMLTRVNQALRANLEKMGKGQYMTITAFCFDRGTVRYAGLHEDILIYRAKQRAVERLATRGVWLGVVDEIGELLHDDTLRMEDDDVLLLITDGVTEARKNGGMMGMEGLSTLFGNVAGSHKGTAQIVKGVLAGLEDFTKGDDVTMVVARRTPESKIAHG